MSISAKMVKELRAITGAGMMDCKKALVENDGDVAKATEYLQKKSLAAVAKRASKVAAEGAVFSYIHDNRIGALVEVNCETDFVAKDDSFNGFAAALTHLIVSQNPADVEALSTLTMASGASVEAERQELIAKIGENISIRRFETLVAETGKIAGYMHGTRIGVLVSTSGVGELGRDLAMHIAASRPVCISEADMPSDVLTREREIYTAQAAESGKSPEIVEKMVDGRVKKFLKENTLLGQPFVKNPDISVAELLSQGNASMDGMPRFEVGEGLEKKVDDFVAEVMAQAKAE